MADWYYSREGQQQGPVPEETFVQWIQSGNIVATDMVWREGAADWMQLGQVPEFARFFSNLKNKREPNEPLQVGEYAQQAPVSLGYRQPSQTPMQVSPHAIEMLRQTKPWVRLFSVLLYIGVAFIVLISLINLIALIGGSASLGRRGGGGALAVGGIFGAILMIAVAALYFMPAMYLGRYASRINALVRMGNQADFEAALEAQKSYWKFLGVLTLILICFYALMFVLLLVVGIGAASRF